jgi:glycosyltransferase involved in cell wall biosynthesis
MKIAVLTSLYPSAVRPTEGLFAERRWLGMRRRGHSVRVVQPLPHAPLTLGRREWGEIRRMAGREERAGLSIERPRYLHLPRRARGNARAFAARGVRAILAGGIPDVVVADYAWPAGWAALELCQRAIPCVVSGRGSDVLQVAGEAGLGAELARALVAAGHWCAVSRDLVEVMDRLAGQPGRGVLVPNGVDLELFRPLERVEARRALGLGERGPLVLVVGHLIERKDPLLALAALAALARQHPEVAGVFVGDGALRERLAAAIGAAGLCARVRCVPRASPEELVRWYAAADALLLTSRREGRPNVVLEALACGRPVLATAAGGTGELLEGLDGMLARTREPADLARALDALLAARWPPERLRAHAARFSWDAGLDALESCLQGAVA